MLKPNWVKIIGLVATLTGFVATGLGEWVADKKMDEKIEQKVNDALAEKAEDEEETEETTEEES